MTYRMIQDRNSGGYFGDEEVPLAYALNSSEEDGLPSETTRVSGVKYRHRTISSSRSNPDEIDELWF
jgi:hypothetical protein